jgi:Ca-activated chloride channel family protein
MRAVVVLLLVFSFTFQGRGQAKEDLSPIIFIYDASGSMWGQLQGKSKMEIAVEVLSSSVNALPDAQKIGLVAYGHRNKSDCKDVEFLVEASQGTKGAITTALQSIKPLGMTPLAYSATQVIEQLRTSKTKATIILLTDGIESCDGDICRVVAEAKEEGIDFRMHIIGFGLKANETEQLKCAANAGEGQYYDASDAGALGTVLSEATSETVDKPKGNVSVYAVKNGVPIDALVTAYDQVAKREPISMRTYRDTAFFYLPPSKYNLEAKPLEGSDVNMITVSGVQSFDEKIIHQDLGFDGGKVRLTTTNNGVNWDCLVKVLDQSGKVAATFRTYDAPKEAEVNPGIYKVTIQAMRIEGVNTYAEIDSVQIGGAAVTPLAYEFDSGTAFIDAQVNGGSIDAVVTVSEVKSGKNVAGGRTYDRGKEFLLNPGTYSVKIAPVGVHKDKSAQTITIEVKKGESTSKTLNF